MVQFSQMSKSKSFFTLHQIINCCLQEFSSQMAFHLPIFFTFFSLAFVASHAALTSEVYWKSVLPDTRMPKAITDMLRPAEMGEEKRTSISFNDENVDVNTGKTKAEIKGNVGAEGSGLSIGKPVIPPVVGVGKGVIYVGTSHRGRPIYVKVAPGRIPFQYKYAAREDQLKDNPNVALFFLENDMHQGTKMNLQFTKSTNAATFLPRKVADTIPFSLENLPEILNQFSLQKSSVEAEMIKKIISECEDTGIVGEEKYCATSLESMIDFSTSKLGKKVKAIATEVNKETGLQTYNIGGVKKMAADMLVVCHKQNYPYAVFYCHKTLDTKAYLVSLVGDDGTNAKAVAVCHEDTAAWNPNHLAFQVLKVKPGTVPICHFLPEDHIIWVPN